MSHIHGTNYPPNIVNLPSLKALKKAWFRVLRYNFLSPTCRLYRTTSWRPFPYILMQNQFCLRTPNQRRAFSGKRTKSHKFTLVYMYVHACSKFNLQVTEIHTQGNLVYHQQRIFTILTFVKDSMAFLYWRCLASASPSAKNIEKVPSGSSPYSDISYSCKVLCSSFCVAKQPWWAGLGKDRRASC